MKGGPGKSQLRGKDILKPVQMDHGSQAKQKENSRYDEGNQLHPSPWELHSSTAAAGVVFTRSTHNKSNTENSLKMRGASIELGNGTSGPAWNGLDDEA